MIGTTAYGRDKGNVSEVIGYFINTLPIVVAIENEMTFDKLVMELSHTLHQALNHQAIPITKLISALNLNRSTDFNPLFKIMVDFANFDFDLIQSSKELDIQLVANEISNIPYDMVFSFNKHKTIAEGIIKYNANLFSNRLIEQFSIHFLQLLRHIISHPKANIHLLPILTASEQKLILSDWNKTNHSYPHQQTLAELFTEQAKNFPDKTALIFKNEKITYGELDERSNQLAHYLRKKGITRGSIVALCLARGIHFIISIVAAIKAGAAYLPLDQSYPAERLKYMVEDGQPHLLITDGAHAKIFSSYQHMVLIFDQDTHLFANPKWRSRLTFINTPNDLAYIIYTSGSTGKPKGVMIEQRNIINLVKDSTLLPATETSVFTHIANITFDAAACEIWGSLLNGMSLCILSQAEVLDFEKFEKIIKKYQATHGILTTALFNQIISERPSLLYQYQHIYFGGERANASIIREFLKKLPKQTKIYNIYGPTECTVITTYYRVKHVAEDETDISIGKPLQNVQVYVLDNHLQPVPIGVMGELYVGGVGVGRGYLNRDELTQERFISGLIDSDKKKKYYKTGDLCRWLSDGRLEYLERVDNQIKIRGLRIELGEIETTFQQHPAVKDAVVIAREDEPGERYLVAYWVSKDANNIPNKEIFRDYLKKELPDYMIPPFFVNLSSFPLSPNGKIDTKKLPKPELPLVNHVMEPRNSLETSLKKIWLALLKIKNVGIQDNFFEIGGHSLLAIQLASQIRQHLQVEITVASIFSYPTIEGLANFIQQHQHQKPLLHPALVALQENGKKQPIFAIHPVGGNVMCYADLSKALGPEQPFYGLQQLFSLGDHPSIEGMASQYIEAIKTIQPQGPYRLLGWSMGGVIATEIAAQLEKQQETVDFIVLIDSYLPNPGFNITQLSDTDLLIYFAKDLSGCYGKHFSLTHEELSHLTTKQQLEFFIAKAKTQELLDASVETEEIILFFNQCKENLFAFTRYQAKIINAPLLLLYASDTHEEIKINLSTDAWKNHTTRQFTMKEIKGNHYTILDNIDLKQIVKNMKLI